MQHIVCNGCGDSLGSQLTNIGSGADCFGILQCSCSEYPVVAGVPILCEDQLPFRSLSAARIVKLLKAGQNRLALLELVTPDWLTAPKARNFTDKLLPSTLSNKRSANHQRERIARWRNRFEELAGATGKNAIRRLVKHYFGSRPGGEYFTFRFCTPKHLASLSLASPLKLEQGAIVDICCGGGHITRYLTHRATDNPVYGIDADFFLLWLANSRIAPSGHYLCVDLERGLPLADGSIRHMLMSNALQFIHGKRLFGREVERVLEKDRGTLVVSSLRHSQYKAVTPNQAIPPQGYMQLVDLPKVMVCESPVVARYMQKMGPDLSVSDSNEALSRSPMISMVATYDQDVLKNHGRMDMWPHELGNLGINPLYDQDKTSGSLALNWPSQMFIEENEELVGYLPESLPPLPEDESQLSPYLEKAVLIDLPDNY